MRPFNFVRINSILYFSTRCVFYFDMNLFFISFVPFLILATSCYLRGISIGNEVTSYMMLIFILDHFNHQMILKTFSSSNWDEYNAITFIYKSFCFELLFDLYHYLFHRLCHIHKKLYAYHSIHHKEKETFLLTTFQIHPIDYLLTNAIPSWLTFIVLSKFILQYSQFELVLLLHYKSFVEMAGHTGIHTNATSFPQFKWLPFVLKTIDHENHHKYQKVNFSKRFKIWDLCFSTFYQS